MKTIQPRKQRKRVYDAPMHKRQKLVSVGLEKKLRKKFNRRTMPLRKGDKVKIARGSHKGIISVVNDIDLNKRRVILEDVKRAKTDGTEIRIPINPSNLILIEPDMTDKMRQKIVRRVKGEFEVKKPKTEKKDNKEKKVEKKESGLKCPVCKKEFRNKTELNAHVEKEHKEYN